MLPKLTALEVRVHAVSMFSVLMGYTTKLTPDDRYRVFERTVELLQDHLLEMTAVSVLRSGGWTDEEVLEESWGKIADWLREHGPSSVVAALDDDDIAWVVTGIRNELRCQRDKAAPSE